MKEVIKTVTFEDVAIGQHFVTNGTRWVKKSNHNASVVTTSEPVFYFGKSELVSIAATANQGETIMATNRTSWETMQRKQLALSCAKDAKALYAGELEKLRLTLDYLRSLRHWMTVASSHRTLKARKLALTEFMGTAAMMERATAALTTCYWDLVPANCQENIRSAIGWAHTATSATTFADWQECCDGAGDFIGDVVCQLEVVQSRVKSNWKRARANMISARTVIDTCAKDILHPVALSKKEKKEIATRNITHKQ